MTTFTFTYLNNYRNHGQNAEQSVRFHLTGEICKADNIPFNIASDVLSYQIKSARATICKGTDFYAYLNMDASTAYIYATNNGIAYVMTKAEYVDFIRAFGTITTDSEKNGGQKKIRLRHETKTMLTWLEARAK